MRNIKKLRHTKRKDALAVNKIILSLVILIKWHFTPECLAKISDIIAVLFVMKKIIKFEFLYLKYYIF